MRKVEPESVTFTERPRKYNWDQLFNGEVWALNAEDVSNNFVRFRALVYQTAKRRGLKARTTLKGEEIFVQALPKSGSE